jgi:hypothetical protein
MLAHIGQPLLMSSLMPLYAGKPLLMRLFMPFYTGKPLGVGSLMSFFMRFNPRCRGTLREHSAGERQSCQGNEKFCVLHFSVLPTGGTPVVGRL